MLAAWHQLDGTNPDALLVRMEEAVAEAMHEAERGRGGDAWAALGLNMGVSRAYEQSAELLHPVAGRHQGAGSAAAAVVGCPSSSAAGPTAAGGPKCYEGGQRGHIRRDCRSRGSGRGQHEGDPSLVNPGTHRASLAGEGYTGWLAKKKTAVITHVKRAS